MLVLLLLLSTELKKIKPTTGVCCYAELNSKKQYMLIIVIELQSLHA